MASALEQQLFLRLGGDISRMAEVLQTAHDEGIEIAPPHQPLIDLLNRVSQKPGADLIGAVREVLRAHLYAFTLEGEALIASHEFFEGIIQGSTSNGVGCRWWRACCCPPPVLKYLCFIKRQDSGPQAANDFVGFYWSERT